MWWPGKKRRLERRRLEAERVRALELEREETRRREREAHQRKRLLDPAEQAVLAEERMRANGIMVTCWRCGSYTPQAKKCRECNVFLEPA